jgi:hypothetical protein
MRTQTATIVAISDVDREELLVFVAELGNEVDIRVGAESNKLDATGAILAAACDSDSTITHVFAAWV